MWKEIIQERAFVLSEEEELLFTCQFCTVWNEYHTQNRLVCCIIVAWFFHKSQPCVATLIKKACIYVLFTYSGSSIIRTLRGNQKSFELWSVRVISSMSHIATVPQHLFELWSSSNYGAVQIVEVRIMEFPLYLHFPNCLHLVFLKINLLFSMNFTHIHTFLTQVCLSFPKMCTSSQFSA